MLRWYTFYGGIRRLLTQLDPSKQFGPHATMALSATPTPWYWPPPFVDNVRWWDDLFLKFLRPPTPDKQDVDPYQLVPLKTNRPTYSTLVTISEIFFGCTHVLGVFPAPSSQTIKLSPFFHPHSIYFHHFHLANEDPEHKAYKQNKNHREGSVLPPAPQEPLPQEATGQEDQERLHAKPREKRTLVGIAKGQIIVVNRRDYDYNICIYSHTGWWYKKTLAEYLVDIFHQFGGPANSNTESKD
jgi:hypothetical protein